MERESFNHLPSLPYDERRCSPQPSLCQAVSHRQVLHDTISGLVEFLSALVTCGPEKVDRRSRCSLDKDCFTDLVSDCEVECSHGSWMEQGM